METTLNEILITNILNYIPKNIKAVSYLMDLLGLSRESVYRRMRGEIPFSLDELAKLSIALNFSIDEIIGGARKRERVFFDLSSIESTDSVKSFYSMLEKFANHIDGVFISDTMETIMAMNRFHPTFLTSFDNLFRFTYYKWLHQNHEVSLKQYFSDIVISPELNALKDSIRLSLEKVCNSILILDPNVFLSLTKDIQYYHQRKLINDDELIILKKELCHLIDSYERIAKTGVFNTNIRIYLYLSPLFINTNMGYTCLENTSQSIFWLFTINPVIVSNRDICELQKRWLNSMKRQSICITQSNEIMQAEFFDKQYEYVNEILNPKNK
ncbi:MAG: hypothetical protein LBO74_15805 [Candidatus Symbiothrix sp.]|nr:hypothetical protein [Candidatus Symbiothrix sp.]